MNFKTISVSVKKNVPPEIEEEIQSFVADHLIKQLNEDILRSFCIPSSLILRSSAYLTPEPYSKQENAMGPVWLGLC